VNRGLAAAESRGFTHALVLNDDAAPEPGCLDALAAAWTADSGAVGPLLIGPQGVESAGIHLSRWGRLRTRTEVPPGGRAVEVQALSGACMLIRAGSRFDAGYRHGMEDVSFCRALRRAGRSVRLVPTVRCRHLGGATLDRRSPAAQRHAVSGHLRLVGGGIRTPVVLGLAFAQVLREGPSRARVQAVGRGWWDWQSGR
jgi:GT2 family glycosyltransferase